MGDEEQATIDGQFFAFAKLLDHTRKRDGLTINLHRLDYWLRQANILDDRKVTMTTTGIAFYRLSKTEVVFNEFLLIIAEICRVHKLDEERTIEAMVNCGLPGQVPVEVPAYRNFFKTYVPKNKLVDA